MFEVFQTVDGQVGTFGEVLAQQSVGVLVRTAWPGAGRVAEIDLHVGGEVKE